MANLSVENLNKLVQTGDVEGLMGENRVMREMESQGMRPSAPSAGGATSFSDMLRNSVDQVNTHQQQADTAIKELVAGRSKNIHETMLTVERADTSLKLMTSVRNKILEAYREIMRMQV